MYVGNIFHVTQQKYICYCSLSYKLFKKSHKCTCFFLCLNCVITERLRVTVNPQSEVVWQPDKQVWVAVLISQQPTQRDKTCVRMLFTQKYVILIHVRHHASIYVFLFFCTVSPTADGNQRRVCLLKQDMSAGEDANCCSGRLSIGNLQCHTPWVFSWVPSRASLRLIA